MCCQYFSCIITKDFKVHWSKRTMAHEDLLAELKLEDKKLEERDFVKIEIAPKNNAKMTRDRDDWVYNVDEERTLPNWYDENVVKCQGACWKAWEESVQVNLAIDKEEKHGKDQLFFAYDSSTVRTSGSSTVEASGSATVIAYGSAKVQAYDSATVIAYDSSTVRTSGSSTVQAYDSATVIAYGSATVQASGSATVQASGSATVELKSDYVTVLCHNKIFVTETAIVVRASVVKAAEV